MNRYFGNLVYDPIRSEFFFKYGFGFTRSKCNPLTSLQAFTAILRGHLLYFLNFFKRLIICLSIMIYVLFFMVFENLYQVH